MKILTRSGALKTGARVGAGPASFVQTEHTRFTHWKPLGLQNSGALTTLTSIVNSIRAMPFQEPHNEILQYPNLLGR